MLLGPATAHRIDLGDLADVDPLVRAHRRARLVHGDRHALALEDLDEHDRGRHAAEVHRRAGPVEQHRLDSAVIAAPISERHGVGLRGWGSIVEHRRRPPRRSMRFGGHAARVRAEPAGSGNPFHHRPGYANVISYNFV